MTPIDNATLFAAVRLWVRQTYPGDMPATLTIKLFGGGKIVLPVPPAQECGSVVYKPTTDPTGRD